MDLPPWFDRFMSPLADRSSVIAGALGAAGVRHRALELSGGRFVVAWPRGGSRDPRYRVKVVTAHHDRVPGTPGALDNSAACLQLVGFLSSGQGAFNTLVVFTDREELGSPAFLAESATPSDQGSYALGRAFLGASAEGRFPEAMGLRSSMVFPLDVSGRGDALVLSRATERLARRNDGGRRGGASESMVAETDAMARTVERMMAGRAPVIRASVPFGEDLGFMLAGLPALTVTVLPRAEAEALARPGDLPAWASPSEPGSRTPETWRRIHGPDDTPALYTDDAFDLVSRFLRRLAALRVPASVA
ncbi:MAG: hypothetical protein CVV47_13725 [Spirochaetae bacterium HGW-Spirochaetae-3]|nr:MAG: hypothetical protein CVV47_13725 [Spirochaetae bacterium HGW-Spirochaetae-3]